MYVRTCAIEFLSSKEAETWSLLGIDGSFRGLTPVVTEENSTDSFYVQAGHNMYLIKIAWKLASIFCRTTAEDLKL